MKVKDTDYLYAAARLRALEGALLTREAAERMIACEDAQAAAKVLAELGHEGFSDGKLSADAAAAAMREGVFSLVEGICPNPEIPRAFRIKYDYHNIKALVKSAAANRPCDKLLSDSGTVSREALLAAAERGDLSALPTRMAQAYTDARDTLARTSDPRAADILLDRAYFEELAGISAQAKSDFLAGYIRALTDAANLRSAVRAYRQGKREDFILTCLFEGGSVSAQVLSAAAPDTLPALFEGGIFAAAAQEGARAMAGQAGFTGFERLLDTALVTYIRAARYLNFGDGPIIAYLAAAENDAQLIRILMAGKLQGLPSEEIRGRLRETYV